jgi:hypothetical protein
MDLFLRILTLGDALPARDIRGTPGGILTGDLDADEALLRLVHELDHVVALTRPLGLALTAIGLRGHDLRNQMSLRINAIERASLVSREDVDPSMVVEAFDATVRAAEYACSARVAVEMVLPLVEGLAVHAEGSLDPARMRDFPYSWQLVVALEREYLLRRQRDLAHARLDAEPVDTDGLTADLAALFVERVTRARVRRGHADAAKLLLLGPGKEGLGPEAAPYFYGSMWLRRLLNHWQATVPWASDDALFDAVHRFVGEVVGFALLDAVQLPAAEAARQVAAVVSAGLHLGDQDIERLLSDPQPLAWDSARRRINSLRGTPGGVAIGSDQDVMIAAVLARLFPPEREEPGSELPGPTDPIRDGMSATFDFLNALDPAKRLHRTDEREVHVVAVDEVERALLLVDTSPGDYDARAAVMPLSRRQLDEFLGLVETDGVPLLRVALASAEGRPFRPDGVVKARLITTLQLWPSGGRIDSRDVTALDVESSLDAFRTLVVDGHAVVEHPVPDEVAAQLKVRDLSDRQLLEGIHLALAREFEQYHLASGRLLGFKGVVDAARVQALFDQFINDPTPELVAIARAEYAEMLMPGWPAHRELELSTYKLGILVRELESRGAFGERAVTRLWSWLATQWWSTGGSLPPDDEILRTVRQVASSILGIPLVATDGSGGWVFDLEPAPEC